MGNFAGDDRFRLPSLFNVALADRIHGARRSKRWRCRWRYVPRWQYALHLYSLTRLVRAPAHGGTAANDIMQTARWNAAGVAVRLFLRASFIPFWAFMLHTLRRQRILLERLMHSARHRACSQSALFYISAFLFRGRNLFSLLISSQINSGAHYLQNEQGGMFAAGLLAAWAGDM